MTLGTAFPPPGKSDVTAPVLSSPNATKTGSTTATVGCTTDTYEDGRVYWVISTSSTKPSAAQVKAGQTHTGAAGADADSWPAPPSPGNQQQGATGLSAGTTYYAHFMHEDQAGNQSAVVTSSSFTTDP